jgi:hypothetical protein
MRTPLLMLVTAACLGLAAPAAASAPVSHNGQQVVSADLIDKAQFASSEKKKVAKRKSMTKRSSWGG